MLKRQLESRLNALNTTMLNRLAPAKIEIELLSC